MNSESDPHLDSDLIIQSLVDFGGLAADEQQHLQVCPDCAAERRRLEQELVALGREARRMAPRPLAPIRLPPETAGRWLPPWRRLIAAAALAAVAVLLLWPPTRYRPVPVDDLRMAEMNNATDEALLSRIDVLVEDALPSEYAALTGLDEAPCDDLTLFIVPAVPEPVPLSCPAPRTGGDRRC